MKSQFVLATFFALALNHSLQAASLVVMSVNLNPGVPGYRAYTLGVKVTAADVAATGPNAVLEIHNFTLIGGAGGPYQVKSGKGTPFTSLPFPNQPDLQGLQTNFIETANYTWPPTDAALASDNGGKGIASLYQDSWWYSSSVTIPNYTVDSGPPPIGSAGALVGYNDSTGELYGVVSTGHTGSSPLPYQNFNTTVGPSANVGTLGYLWQPTGNGIIGGSATGSTMTFSGLYGPTGLNSFSSSPLSDMFSDGAQIVPLVQILLNGNLAIPDNYQNGNGTYISLGSSNFDLFGRPVGPYADLQLLFQQNVVISPEPGTWNLIVVAAICLIAGRRFRVR